MFIQLIGVPITILQQIANPRTGQLGTMPVSRVALFALDTEGTVWEYGGPEKGWQESNMTKLTRPPESLTPDGAKN